MWKIKKTAWYIIAAGLLISIASCTNQQTKNKSGQDNSAGNISDSSLAGNENKEQIFFLIPSPGEILERFHNSGIQYNPGLLNSAGNKDKYLGSKAQSLNLGVYIADLAYLALFERSTETVSYLETIQSLGVEAGISSSIYENLLVRAKANAGNMDSLLSISNEAFGNMKEFLENGGKENMIARISAGAYIESMYIALQSMNKFSVSGPLPELLTEMKYPTANLVELARNVITTENDSSLYQYINQVSLIFNEMETRSSKILISQPQAGRISISGGEKLRMNENEFNSLRKTVTGIREEMVGY